MKKILIIMLLFHSFVCGQSIDNSEVLRKMLVAVDRMLRFAQVRTSEQVLDSVAGDIRKFYDRQLQNPQKYKTKVLRECSAFPEGGIYPFALPAMAYANIALRDTSQKQHCLRQMEKLIDILIPIVEQKVMRGKKLEKLKSYRKEATYLSTLNLVLANYHMLGGKNQKYRKLYSVISEALFKALEENKGKAIDSYPEYSWNFDTIIALLSLHLYDDYQNKNRNKNRSKKLLQNHLRWLKQNAMHPQLGLPYSVGYDQVGIRRGLPRGCDLSMNICLLRQMDKQAAERLYEKYAENHWVDQGFVAGFSEWPRGYRKYTGIGDMDSGPIVFDIGVTATGVGVGTVLAMNDKTRLDRLCRELAMVPSIKKMLRATGSGTSINQWFDGIAEISPQYFTGFLFGDAILFYAVTWTEY